MESAGMPWSEQTTQAFHADGRFAAAGRAGEEGFGVEGGIGDLALFFGQVHRSRVAERGGFVNRKSGNTGNQASR